uniref:UPF3A regulator of nonsense mediated mRNA decay n=1 Tax=Neogobius melanostomus TaxID=47308 RepID=A0A8C6SN66_9GOBI
MRSEKDQMTVSKEKSTVEIQFRDIPREQDNTSANAKQKEEKREIFTKVVIRRLPPGISKDQLEEQLSPLPSYDYFEFFSADQSLYPHLFSRAYINFKNPEDILHFRDRFDGYVFIDNKGLEYSAVVEFAPFQKISKKKLKKKMLKLEYKRFLEIYSCDEEKSMANPETLLGEIEAKTRELIAKRTTPLLEYIKNKKIEKQRIREEKREERRRRELEKKRQREEEKRKRREEERRKRKEVEKQKKLSEKDIKIKVNLNDNLQMLSISQIRLFSACVLYSGLSSRGQPESDKEQQHSRRQREKDHRVKDEERKRQRHHYEFDKFMRRKDETKWGKGYCQDREERRKKEGHHHSYNYCPDSGDKLSKEDHDELGNRKERLRNKDRPAMQLYQPGARNRKRMSSSGKGFECIPAGHSPEPPLTTAMTPSI